MTIIEKIKNILNFLNRVNNWHDTNITDAVKTLAERDEMNSNEYIKDMIEGKITKFDTAELYTKGALTHIGDYAFYNYKNLQYVKLTDGIKDIGIEAFMDVVI